MIIKAEQKYVRTSPRKLRLVANAVRKLSPALALVYLERINKRATLPLAKTIKQALANAKNNAGVDQNSLKIKELAINQGPVYKRAQPVSRGMAHPIAKRTSHIRVILEAKEETKVGTKS